MRPADPHRATPARYVFVCGLHRSGTSLVARLIAAHPEVAALEGTGVPEDEGVYLQGAIPHDATQGVPGSFAFDPAQHLTETSPFNSLETARRMARDWAPFYRSGARWRVEKSPVNLLRTRLYQQLFPRAQFVFVLRHPSAVAQATRKWTDRALPSLVAHWDVAHAIACRDMAHLHAALVLRYEDLVADPAREMARVFAFLDLLPPDPPPPGAIRCGNSAYDGDLALDLPRRALRLGYRRGLDVVSPDPAIETCRHPLRHIRDAVCAAVGPRPAADAGANAGTSATALRPGATRRRLGGTLR